MAKPIIFTCADYSLIVSSGKSKRLKRLSFQVFYQDVVTAVKIALRKFY